MRITETTPPAPKPPREFTLAVTAAELKVIHGALGETTSYEGYLLFCAVNKIVVKL